MAENLKVTHYRNGNPIPNVTDNIEWGNLSAGAYCNCGNDEGYVATYGRLYNWYAVDDNRIIAPEGWHVPTDDEWKQLEMFLGMSESETDNSGGRGTDEGGKLKETGTTHWWSPNTGATNEFGFTGLPGGHRWYQYEEIGSIFLWPGNYAAFWSSTAGSSYSAWDRGLDYTESCIGRSNPSRGNGFSVRCVRD